MAKIRLDLSQFKASGIYTVEFDASESVVVNTQTTRLVVGFSKKGPINAPVFCQDPKTARRIFGDIDRDLENKGSFFHRSLFTCLETGPCFALNLMPLDNDIDSPTADYDTYKSMSLSVSEANGSLEKPLYSSYFNKEKFYYADADYFLATVNSSTSPNAGKLFNITNLGQTPFSIIVKKTGDLQGFNVTARDWYGQDNIPAYIKEFDFISDYFVNIDIVAGDWTDFETLSVDPIYSTYFNSKGIIKEQLSAFLNAPTVTRLGSFQGSLIPDLIDNNGVNHSLDTIVNAAMATTGLFLAIDRDALTDYDPTSLSTVGRFDTIGHSLINSDTTQIDFLSYKFLASEYADNTENLINTVVNNTFTIDFGPSASANLPAGLGATGASYDPAANGFGLSGAAAYYTSYYGSGNNGKFNNVLNIRKEALSTTQYSQLSNLKAGSSIALKGAAGATQYATIASVNEVLIGSDIRLKLGIAHPDKQDEGTATPKTILEVGTDYIIVGGTAAGTDVNVGDFIYAKYNTTVQYFKTTALGTTAYGATTDNASVLSIDITNTEYNGSAIDTINTLYTVNYGSLFDVIESPDSTNINELKVIYKPDVLNYTSVSGGESYYTGYEFSTLYQDFNSGVLTTGDKTYVLALGDTPLYLQPTFGVDTDAVKTITVKAYYDAALTIGYTGAWDFGDIVDSTGATITPDAFRIYSLTGDFVSTVGATGFNSTRTTFYVTAADQSKISVGQFLVADPTNSGDPSKYILTRVLTKKTISSGTYTGYYQVNVNQRLANYGANVVRYKTIDQMAPAYQPTYLSGFKITSYHVPNGSDAQLTKILNLLDPAYSGLSSALESRHIISFRYIIDTFNGGLQPQSAPKNIISKLAMRRQKCMAILNTPSIKKFSTSTDPRFTELPTATDPKPILNTAYIADGGNLSLSPSFTYSLPDEENGSKFAGFFAPFLVIRENNKNISIPPAADVSNNFIRKFINGQPYSIVAGPRRGVLSNPLIVGLEYDFSDTDREYLEPMGWNPIVYRRGTGYMIYGNQAAYQKTLSAFNNLHVRDLLITIEEAVEDILAGFIFEFNDASTRTQIKSIVDAYLNNVKSNGGVYAFATIMDGTNNTNDIIDQNFAIIDIGIEPVRGAQKFINRVTVLKTGGIASGGFTVA
jgi:hypothetical protein